MIEAALGVQSSVQRRNVIPLCAVGGQGLSGQRCLIPASEFQMRVGDDQYRVTLDSGHFFYLAAIREPAMGEWPVIYRIITVAANKEISRYQDRHSAIIHRPEVMQWLDFKVPERDILATPPANMFRIEPMSVKPVQTVFAGQGEPSSAYGAGGR